ncbi:MAG: ABC transporter permease [Promethearchaeota archaeon]
MFKFAIRNAFRKKSIASLCIIGVAIGIALMTAMSSLGATISDQASSFAQQNLDSIMVQQEDGNYYFSRFNLTKIQSITQIDHIDAYSAQVIHSVQLHAGSPISPSLVGVNLENDTAVGGGTSKLTRGRIFQNDNECIMGGFAASFLDLELGGEISVFNELTFELVNITIVGLFSADFFSEMNIYTTIGCVRQFKSNFTDDTYCVLLIKADSPESVDSIKDEIERISEYEELGVEILSFDEQLGSFTQFMDTINILVFSISLIAGIAGGMSIVVAMLMSVMERMKEFATLKATGWQNMDVVKDIIYESLIITSIGGVFGFCMGVGFLQAIETMFVIALNPLQIQVFLQLIGFVIGMGIVGGIYPALKASKVSPVKILRGE